MRTAYIAYCFFREALHRLIGTRRDASLATTLFTTGLLGVAVAEVTSPIFRAARPGRPKPPSAVNFGAGLVGARLAAQRIGGEQLRNSPFADAIILTGLIAPAVVLIKLPARLARIFLTSFARVWRYATGAVARPVRNAVG
jgi:hypothetical protein